MHKSTPRQCVVAMALAAAAVTAAACGGDPPAPDEHPAALSIAAASDLRFALDDLVAAYRADHPGTGVSVTYGSSGAFYAQILNGAPFDLFLSADIAYARQLGDRGVAAAETLFTYANGRLVVWVAKGSTLDVEALGLKTLLDPSVTRVAIANPAHAPYGIAAEDALRAAGLYDEVQPKLVLGENVSQTLQFVQSGAAQAGLVALSLASASSVEPSGRYFLLPADAHSPLEQGGIVMTAAARPDAARSFRAFMLSQAGRAVLTRYGFALPEP